LAHDIQPAHECKRVEELKQESQEEIERSLEWECDVAGSDLQHSQVHAEDLKKMIVNSEQRVQDVEARVEFKFSRERLREFIFRKEVVQQSHASLSKEYKKLRIEPGEGLAKLDRGQVKVNPYV